MKLLNPDGGGDSGPGLPRLSVSQFEARAREFDLFPVRQQEPQVGLGDNGLADLLQLHDSPPQPRHTHQLRQVCRARQVDPETTRLYGAGRQPQGQGLLS